MTAQDPRSGGTVYGPGGVDPRPRHNGGLFDRVHPAVTAAVAGAVVVLFGLGFLVWRSAGEPDELVDTAATAAAPVASERAEETPAVAPKLAAGTWTLEVTGAPGRFLTRDDDQRAVLAAEGLSLTVTAGLADGACFTFSTGDGRYLRHFDYRLRFDPAEDADLFRNDATFCPEDGADGSVTLRSKNYPGHLIHARGDDLYIDEGTGTAFTPRPPA